ncbi:MAG: hypothetical protein AABZ48_05375 [candidate division NC10 bacterium]
MRVLVIDTISAEGIAHLREHGFEVDEIKKPSAQVGWRGSGLAIRHSPEDVCYCKT